MIQKQDGDFSCCNPHSDRGILSMECRKKPGELKYPFRNDIVFKMVFSKNPPLLKRFTASLIGIHVDSITKFEINNSEITPEAVKDKFCRLDISMTVNEKMTDLEIQVDDEGDYPERSLYYWAGLYHSSLKEGQKYITLPQTVHVSILAFRLFDCEEFHSEFQVQEVRRHEQLTDKMSMHFFELGKLPKELDPTDELQLWLSLFNAKTEEDLAKIEAMEVPIMRDAVGAYRQVTATDEFRELERIRSRSRHNEASALYNAECRGESRGEQREREKWQTVIAEKEAVLAEKDTLIAKLRAQLNNS